MSDLTGLAGMTPDEEGGPLVDRTTCSPWPPAMERIVDAPKSETVTEGTNVYLHSRIIEGDKPFDPFAALEAAGIAVPELIVTPTADDPEPESPQPSPEWESVVEEARNIVAGGCLQEGDLGCFPPFLPSKETDITLPVFPTLEGINPKDSIASKKPDLSLIPSAGMLYASQAMMDGARKYGPYNWRENPVLMRVYIAAAQRHLAQLLDGEDFDPVSNVHHIGHAIACLVILADARETGNLKDDRPLPGPAGQMIRRFEAQQSFVPESAAAA